MLLVRKTAQEKSSPMTEPLISLLHDGDSDALLKT